MDALKGFAEKAMKGGSEQQGSSTGQTTGQTGAQQGGQSEDYLDKGVDAVEKKFGVNMSRDQNEKYTDMGREQYEKMTGSKMNSKFSN